MVVPLYFTNTTDAPRVLLTPDNAAFSYSDYCAVSVTAARARFSRGLADGQGLESVAPGARVRFATTGGAFTIRLQYTNLVTAAIYSGFGAVLVDGAVYQQFGREQGNPGPLNVFVNLTVAPHLVEIVMPLCASVDFLGIDTGPITPAAARSATRWVAAGDSITQGFYATAIDKSWPEILTMNKGYELANYGYGGRKCVAVDGTAAANLNPTMASYLIGYNDFGAQTALATFKAAYAAFLTNFRAIKPNTKLYCITPIHATQESGTLTLEQYRVQIRAALVTANNALNVLVEGPGLIPNSPTYLADGIHPNDAGAAAMAAALAPIVVP